MLPARRYKLVLAPGERQRIRDRFRPSEEKMRVIASLVHRQIEDRFESEGASGGIPWPKPKWIESIGRPDGRKLLHGRTGHLRESYQESSDANTATVASDSVAAAMAQAGTVGKGGDLPDITPKHARVLFIPISERAMDSEPVTALGIRTRQAKDGAPLIRGRIKDGKLVPPDADFLLLHKVSIPPRDQLPTSCAEREKQTDTVIEVLKDGP